MKPSTDSRNPAEPEKMKNRGKAPVPREHGAWFVLFGSVLVGTAAAGRMGEELLLFASSVFFLFLAREPLSKLLRTRLRPAPRDREKRWKQWLAVELLLATLTGLPLLLVYRRWELLWFAGLGIGMFAIHLWWAERRLDRTLTAQLLGMVGLTAAAPAAVTALRQADSGLLLTVWMICSLYFASGVFYVRMRVAAAVKPARWPQNRALCLGYHLLLAIAVSVLTAGSWLHDWSWLGYLPVVVRGLCHALCPAEEALNIRSLGYTEAAYSVFFVSVQAILWLRS